MIKPKCVFKNFFKKKERRRWSSGQLLLRLALLRFIPPNSDGNDQHKLSSLCHHHSPINLLHACQDSNLKLLVLETSTLPIELHTHLEVSTGIEPV